MGIFKWIAAHAGGILHIASQVGTELGLLPAGTLTGTAAEAAAFVQDIAAYETAILNLKPGESTALPTVQMPDFEGRKFTLQFVVTAQ